MYDLQKNDYIDTTSNTVTREYDLETFRNLYEAALERIKVMEEENDQERARVKVIAQSFHDDECSYKNELGLRQCCQISIWALRAKKVAELIWFLLAEIDRNANHAEFCHGNIRPTGSKSRPRGPSCNCWKDLCMNKATKFLQEVTK